ncbi:MAG: CNNM domain-containing protein [Thermoanaerobaculia bacterium]
MGVSFVCSLLEAALLSSRNVNLAHQRDEGSRGAGLLLNLKQTHVDDAISAILTLNTVANTLGATLAGAQAARVFGSAWVGFFSAALTFLILVVSEIIPKTLGAVYSRHLSGIVGWSLHVLTRAMMPVLVISRLLTRLLTRGHSPTLSRGELASTIASAAHHGAISPGESRIFENLLRFEEVRVEDVMTPRTVAIMLPADATIADLLADREAEAVSRIPLFRDSRDNVVGYVLQREVLKRTADGCHKDITLESLMRPISFIPEVATVASAMRQILERREPIAMAIDEHGGVSGLVTLEDLTETVLGVEIIDESDRIVDQRQAAAALRDQRMERMQRRRKL